MEYRELGRTGLRVSPITIGTWQLAGPLALDGRPDGHPDPGREQVLRLIRTLGDRGINAVDTAEQYGGGQSERRVGEAIRGDRDRWVVSTKFGYRVAADGTREDDSSPRTILPSLEGSLRRLQTDYIDVYLYHCAPHIADLERARDVLMRAKDQGKIRFVGISTRNVELVRALGDHEMLDVVQFPTSLLEPARPMSRYAAERQIGTQVRGIMAQGRLSGRYFQGAPKWSRDDRRSADMADHDFTRYAQLQTLLPEGYSIVDVAVRWALDSPGHHTICAGAKRLEDYEAMLSAVEKPPLGDEVTQRLEELAERLA